MHNEQHQPPSVSMSPVAAATSFIYSTFSRLVLERNDLPANVRWVEDIHCSYCESNGPGVIDSRAKAVESICKHCWSLLANAASFFPGRSGKVRSILGLMGMHKAHVVFTGDGAIVYVSENAIAQRVESFPLELTQDRLRYTPGRVGTILDAIASGSIRPPFVWIAPTRNKESSMLSLRLTTDERRVAHAMQGVIQVYDCRRLDEIHRRLAALPPEILASDAVSAWLDLRDLYGAAGAADMSRSDAMALRRERARAGIDTLMLTAPQHERDAIRVMLSSALSDARRQRAARVRKERKGS